MINTKDQILGLIQRNQDSIRGFGVSKIGLFGSYARGEQNDNSDIDIIVQFERDKKSYLGFINLAEYLEKLFNRKVDLLTDKGISPFIKSKIEKETVYVSLVH